MVNYSYSFLCILKNPKVYIEDTIVSPSFVLALHLLIEKRKINDKVFLIFCKKKNGDLQLMGSYDGLSMLQKNGERITGLLKTIEEKEYSLFRDGFRRVFL